MRGSVIKYDANAASSSFSIGGAPGGGGLLGGQSLGVKGGHAMIAISLRVIDTTTGQVLTTVKAEGTASNREMGVSSTSSSGLAISATSAQETPLGRAAEMAIDKAVPQIALAADHTPWTAAVIDVDGPTVYVNAGEGDQERDPRPDPARAPQTEGTHRPAHRRGARRDDGRGGHDPHRQGPAPRSPSPRWWTAGRRPGGICWKAR